MSRGWPIVLAALLAWSSSSSRGAAQSLEAVSLGRFQPAAAPTNFIVTDRARSLRHLELSVAAYLDYAQEPFLGETDGGEIAIVGDRLGGELLLALGLFDRVELGVGLPAALAQSSEGNRYQVGAALGDLRILPKLMLVDVGPLGVGVRVPFELPTGDDERFSGFPGLRVVPGLVVSVDTSVFGAGMNFGYRYRAEAVEVSAADSTLLIDHELVGSFGLRVTPIADRLDILADGYVNVGIEQTDREEYWSEAWLAVRLRLPSGLSATVGGGPGFTEGPGTPAFRVFLGLGLVAPLHEEPPADRDGDRIPDDRDACQGQPEDYDGHDDLDGCPETEPPRDSDGDGLIDELDRCTAEAEDKDGFEDDDGCPDPDNDADGVLDAADRCATEAEDKDGFEDEDGCPEADNDGDGMLDPVDLCPAQAEVKNGFEDDDGCPDAVPEAVKKFEGTLQGIVFATNKAEIRPPSRPTLVAVAKAMNEYPSLRVLVRGHTDNRGSATRNEQLSFARAQAVKDFLVAEGVAADRITVQGLGPNEPIDTNDTAKGRANNRRIEFRIQSP